MPYVENRVVHDADSHLMELPDSLDEFLEAGFRARYDALPKLNSRETPTSSGKRAPNRTIPCFVTPPRKISCCARTMKRSDHSSARTVRALSISSVLPVS